MRFSRTHAGCLAEAFRFGGDGLRRDLDRKRSRRASRELIRSPVNSVVRPWSRSGLTESRKEAAGGMLVAFVNQLGRQQQWRAEQSEQGGQAMSKTVHLVVIIAVSLVLGA